MNRFGFGFASQQTSWVDKKSVGIVPIPTTATPLHASEAVPKKYFNKNENGNVVAEVAYAMSSSIVNHTTGL